MKIEDVLAQVDEIKPNTYDDNIKILWLSELDGQIYNTLVLTHVQDVAEEEVETLDDDEESEETEDTGVVFKGYTDADYGTELIAPFPYDRIYREYIFAQIDYSNGESDRYANSSMAFNTAFKEFSSWYNKTHRPISKPMKIV